MTLLEIIIAITVIIFLILCFIEIRRNMSYKDYVARKQSDQRKFNPIREKVWWRK